jgi:L-amino acid N-acyltransferase YncA
MASGNNPGNNLQISWGVTKPPQPLKLTLRPTGLSSPAYRSWLDYVIVEDGRDVGRLYEDRNSRPEYRWFWSITVYVDPKRGITTSGRASSIEEAKALFLRNWQKCRTDSTPAPRPST